MSRNRLPQQFIDRLTQQFGKFAVDGVLKAFQVRRLPTLRTNLLKATDEQVMVAFREENIAFERVKAVPHAFKVRNRTDEQLLDHALMKSGMIYMQGLSSMIPPLLMELKKGEVVLDLCAAPGSKTSEIAALMQNDGRIVAVEENEVRYQKLLNTLNIQGGDVETICADAGMLWKTMPETFDKILADVPCSAEGRINLSSPRTYRYWSEKNIVAHAKLQRRLLRSAVRCLKPGGLLVYSTCTLAPEENERMVEWLMEEFPEIKSLDVDVPLRSARKTAHKTVTLLPNEETEGFFVAKLRKDA